jgi:hypothetical protein
MLLAILALWPISLGHIIMAKTFRPPRGGEPSRTFA